MSNKRLKFKDSKEFQRVVTEDFLPTLRACNPRARIGSKFVHGDICQVHVQASFQQEVYSVYRDANTGYAEYCKGTIDKYQPKSFE